MIGVLALVALNKTLTLLATHLDSQTFREIRI